jgi:enoyl-CoA hydratase/carnithine racemase
MPESVLIEINNYIATLTLNNPSKLNAFSDEMLLRLVALIDECERNDDVRVIVLTGAGKGFCSGGDVTKMGPAVDNRPHVTKSYITEVIQAFPKKIEHVTKPIIASINGVAAGGGLDLALACDIRVAGESATMAETYCNIGLLPGGGGAWLLPRIVGQPKALEMLLAGNFIDANEAYRIGMINHVWPDKELAARTYRLASDIAENPPLSVRLTKQAVIHGMNTDMANNLDLVSSHISITKNGPDHSEAIKAFREKRKGNFIGH